MKKVGELMQTPQISQMKQESLLSLSQEKHIQDFFKDNYLDMSLMQDYWVELLDYNDDFKTCLHCPSLEHCPKDNQGMRKKLAYYDQEIIIELQSCQYGKQWEEKRNLLNQFVITNVNESLLLTDINRLDILKKEKLTTNEKVALAQIKKYSKEPTETGLFLHGEMRTGKTTLLAALMNALAKEKKEIGFIHFPTFLIDLKASFSSKESDNSLDKLMKVDYLLLDGIGEENVTQWSRDEVLLTILSYRLLNHLPTFFNSMYGYKELNKVYTIKKGDEIRANTITAKMKALSIEIMLDGEKIR